MKKIVCVSALWVLLIIISSFSLLADTGPKPTADIYVTMNGLPISDASFGAKMLTCRYEMKYEALAIELSSYVGNDWSSNCEKVAPKYGFDREVCYGQLGEFSKMEKLPDVCRENDAYCMKLPLKTADNEKGCFWTVERMAWGGNCADSACRFNYVVPQSFRLAVYLPSTDKVYISPETVRENFRSTYSANMMPDGTITLKDTTAFVNSDLMKNMIIFLVALVITLVLELAVALLFLRKSKNKKRLFITVAIANLITLPIVWFIFPLLKDEMIVIVSAELFAFVFEGCFIHLVNKNHISMKRALVLSLLMNLMSMLLGGVAFFCYARIFGFN